MKKLLALALSIALLATGCGKATGGGGAAASPEAGSSVQADETFYGQADLSSLKGKKIGITIQSLQNAYWAGIMTGLTVVLEENGADYDLYACDQNVDTQIGQLENFITLGYDLIIVHPQDAGAVEEVCAEARAAGIKVICWDSTMENVDVNFVLDNDTLGKQIGRLAGEFINQHYDAANKAQVVVIGASSVDVLVARADGIKAGMEEVAGGKYNIAAEIDGLTSDEAEINMNSLLATHPEITVAVGIGSGAMIGGNNAYMNMYQSAVPDNVGVITTDVTKTQLTALLNGEAAKGIVGFEGSDVQTGNCAASLIALTLNNQVGAKDVYRQISSITMDNVADILNNMY
ncbi:MAG: sugar ABC transporter substrate-binding protein [Pseudobutyrivibrio sp.]|nr:sugar ABC transporter substrate-binding protein [Pseudobutyrivibrio sp.]